MAVAAFGALGGPSTSANPTTISVVNTHVSNAIQGSTVDLTSVAGRTPAVLANVPAFQSASAGQIDPPAGPAGDTVILVKTDGSTTALVLNGRGLVCTPVCDGTTSATIGSDNYAAWTVTGLGTHALGDTFTVTTTQDGVSLDSSILKVVGQAHDLILSVLNSQTTLQAGASTCSRTQPVSPTTAHALAAYTDIDGEKLVGYAPTLTTSSATTLAIGSPLTFPATSSGALHTMVNTDSNVGAEDAVCGNTANPAAATLTATSASGEISGITGTVSRTIMVTVAAAGVPSAIALTASPLSVACDGAHTSTVTARVTDFANNNVPDGTAANFSVVSQGTASPVNTTTTSGSASSMITPLSAATTGVTVTVTSGGVNNSIVVGCNPFRLLRLA